LDNIILKVSPSSTEIKTPRKGKKNSANYLIHATKRVNILAADLVEIQYPDQRQAVAYAGRG
jgi:hypothetical protein